MDGEEVAVPVSVDPMAVIWGRGVGTWAHGAGGADDAAGGLVTQDLGPHAGGGGPFEASWPSCLKGVAAAPQTPHPLANGALGYSPGALSPAAFPWSTLTPSEAATASRKRLSASPSPSDDMVAALLPKMKRMRLKPSFGQLRLQREAEDMNDLPPEVKLAVEPEQLRATVSIDIPTAAYGSVDRGSSDLVYLEFSFPPQYPHRPPKIAQVAPLDYLPCWKYDGPFVLLQRLSETVWSPAMGISDILRDLLSPSGWQGAGSLTLFEAPSRIPPGSHTLGDVEMV